MCIYVCICGGGSVYILFSAVFVIKAVSIEQAKCITIFCFFLLTERTLLGLCVFLKKATKIQYSTMKLRVFIYIRVTRYIRVCVCVCKTENHLLIARYNFTYLSRFV